MHVRLNLLKSYASSGRAGPNHNPDHDPRLPDSPLPHRPIFTIHPPATTANPIAVRMTAFHTSKSCEAPETISRNPATRAGVLLLSISPTPAPIKQNGGIHRGNIIALYSAAHDRPNIRTKTCSDAPQLHCLPLLAATSFTQCRTQLAEFFRHIEQARIHLAQHRPPHREDQPQRA